MMQNTIAAVSTAPGGALAIVRISGPLALQTVNKITYGPHAVSPDDARKALLRHALSPDGEPCLVIYMPGPASYTGEDVAEIQCHGGDFAPSRLLKAAYAAGVSPAEPGEFTRRAFLNGKLDLTQAEAVMDLISAKSSAAGKLAERQMAGSLGSALRGCRMDLIRILSEIESRMDFPEEDLDWVSPVDLCDQLNGVLQQVERLLSTARAGALVRDGIRLVIAGAPNVGKSSLLNELLGYDRAIVTEIPGTTRDTLEELIQIRGMMLRVIDTAGLHESQDVVEEIGIERSRRSLKDADVIVWLLDASNPAAYTAEIARMNEECPPEVPLMICWNKVDLLPPGTVLPEPEALNLSVAKHQGLEALFDRIEREVWRNAGKVESDCAVAERHVVLLRNAAKQIQQTQLEVKNEDWELAASCLHNAVQNFGRVTGENADPDILDEIFARFCIGK